ncbi:MAG: hypothetical protein R3B90_00205 [Planctomycetaceae bacterium]
MDLVEHVAKQIAAFHAVANATEDVGDNFLPPSPLWRLKASQIGKETGAFLAVGRTALLWLMKSDEFRPVMPFRLGRPITPSVRPCDHRAESFVAE